MAKTKSVFKWWTGWEPEKIERWIEGMEAQGWHLTRVRWNAIWFYFEKGEPRTIRYGVDYQQRKDPNYIGIFEDAGWELLYSGGSWGGWFIWRMAYTASRPEIYSDTDSLIDRNKRLMSMFSTVLLAQAPLIMVNWQHIHDSLWLTSIYIILLVIMVYALLRLVETNRSLKKQKDR